MEASVLRRGIHAAASTASGLGLTVEDGIVLRDSNRAALRLVPCDVLASVSHGVEEAAVAGWTFRLGLVQRLVETGCPVVTVEPRVPARVYDRDGFAITFWAYHAADTLWKHYYGAAAPGAAQADRYAGALLRLHAGMRAVDVATPHFMEWVDGAQRLLERPGQVPPLAGPDRDLIRATLAGLTRSIADRGAPEQLLHGEPHPDNVLDTATGPLFIDWDTPCRGPVEYDLAYVPDQVAPRYPGADEDLLNDCRGLVLARLALIRCEPGDQLPDGPKQLQLVLGALRRGPPWPTVDVLYRGPGGAD